MLVIHFQKSFVEKFERPGIPVIIRGATRDWPATKKWNVKARLPLKTYFDARI
jgi:hypothetical protein